MEELIMKCMACSKELNRKEVVYTEDKTPYCVNPFTCSELHPNSVQNIVKRGGAVRMFTENELESNVFDKYDVTQEMKERVIKIANKPQSIRLTKFEIAHYLIWLQDTKNLSSISEAVRYCVQLAMDVEPVTNTTPQTVQGATNTEIFTVNAPEPKKLETTGVTIVVGDKPKTPQELIMEQIKQKEKKEEEEFSF